MSSPTKQLPLLSDRAGMVMKQKFHKISWVQLEKDCLELAKKIKGLRIDKIVAISRGGLVVARIFSDLLFLPISHITIVAYQNLKQQKEPVITEIPSKKFDHETILIIDEIVDSGKTFKRALSYFKQLPIKKIYTLSLYIKSKTDYFPDFWLKKIDAWIIFPYELQETAQAFIKMFKNKDKARKQLLKVGFKKWEIAAIKINP